ncbi:MAG: hypothetical protein VB050_04215 [Geobacteraceae bacterium]|nr:hypothetical protein [Geobacteraceae bacterium]
MSDPFAAFAQIFPTSLSKKSGNGIPAGSYRVFLPEVSPLAAPFILFRLKRGGYSACRVTVIDRGLLVSASR